MNLTGPTKGFILRYSTMIRILAIVGLVLLILPGAVYASERFSGQWNMVHMSFTVTVESWGEHCGPEPASYTSNKVRPVEITAKGKHLVFSQGGMRTDTCISPNPYIRSTFENISAGQWQRTCQTGKDNPKFEWSKYTLSAYGDDRLEFTADSRYDWTLKGDHCLALSSEKRTYERVKAGPGAKALVESPPKEPTPTPTPSPQRDLDRNVEEVFAAPGCEKPGPATRMTITPEQVTLGPGERICFKAEAVDKNRCKFSPAAAWTVTQEDERVDGLISRTGCFNAGETAADSEGLYVVTARANGKSDTAEVSVVFPDLGELLAARLKPLEDIEGEQKSSKKTGIREPEQRDSVGTTPTTPVPLPAVQSLVPPPGESAENGGSQRIFLLFIGVMSLIILSFFVYWFLVRRRRPPMSQRYGGSRSDAQPAKPRGGASTMPKSEAPAARIDSGVVVCTQCNRVFPPGARFCPHDGASLQPSMGAGKSDGKTSKGDSNIGMICPKCHRGYEAGANFCPHDSEALIPYFQWREINIAGPRK